MNYNIKLLKPFFFGLAWLSEDFPQLRRIPKRISTKLSKELQNLSTHLSGVRIRFQSKTTFISISIKFNSSKTMEHFTRFGQSGVDFYLDGLYWKTFFHSKQLREVITLPQEMQDGKLHDFEFYLPLYNGIKDISLDVDQFLLPPKPFATKLPVIYYGSSITQGGCASRPALSYSNLISRLLNLDCINLGFSGNGYGEIELAHLISELEGSLYVLDWGVNLIKKNFSIFESRYEPFAKVILDNCQDAKIVLVNFQHFARERESKESMIYIQQFRDHIHNIYEKLYTKYPERIFYVDAGKIIGLSDMDKLVDGTHPNDCGMLSYANALKSVISKIIK